MARLSFALDFGSDVAAIFHRRKFRAEVLYRRRDAILSSAFARYQGAGEAGVGRHPWPGRRAGAPEFLSNCGEAKYFIALCRDPAGDVCMVTRKDVFSDLDGFDENLPGNLYMEKKWSGQILRDPYYSPNLSLHPRGFELAFPPRWENEAAITEAD